LGNILARRKNRRVFFTFSVNSFWQSFTFKLTSKQSKSLPFKNNRMKNVSNEKCSHDVQTVFFLQPHKLKVPFGTLQIHWLCWWCDDL